mmetsp:Transcript_28050/g.63193  ORF Transcript_28050/g.63193 Transcript_28050/m.63193 type:complete len:514 (-) Transcript_28050:321-1862(-)
MQGASASATSVRRLRRELQLIQQSPNAQVAVKPSSASLLEWHFALHSLPADTPYSGGCYHGRLLFPSDYPHAPPTVVMVTPSGRLETGCRLCLSMTDFHPESWNPAWSVDTILTGLLSYFLSDAESGYGSVRASWETRLAFAEASWAQNLADPEFVQLFPELTSPSRSSASDQRAASRADSQARECWICRDVGDEPLIHPCACRGSMSGVHASCVEQWMRHMRRAGGTGRPRCGVCREPYLGREEQPGIGSFAFHYVQDFAGQLVRSAVLVMMLMGFQDCLQGKEASLPLAARAVFVLFFRLCNHTQICRTGSFSAPPPTSAALTAGSSFLHVRPAAPGSACRRGFDYDMRPGRLVREGGAALRGLLSFRSHWPCLGTENLGRCHVLFMFSGPTARPAVVCGRTAVGSAPRWRSGHGATSCSRACASSPAPSTWLHRFGLPALRSVVAVEHPRCTPLGCPLSDPAGSCRRAGGGGPSALAEWLCLALYCAAGVPLRVFCQHALQLSSRILSAG